MTCVIAVNLFVSLYLVKARSKLSLQLRFFPRWWVEKRGNRGMSMSMEPWCSLNEHIAVASRRVRTDIISWFNIKIFRFTLDYN